MQQRVGPLLIIVVTWIVALATPALAGGTEPAGGSGPQRGAAAPTYTEDNDTNDGGTPNHVVDDGDNAHPSGKDRSVEPGGSGNQGRARSDPDDDGRGPDRTNGGVDQPNGPGGVDRADQDGNNGCGNDDDFEDDNEGLCGGRGTSVKHRTTTTVKHRPTTTVAQNTTTTVRQTTTTRPGATTTTTTPGATTTTTPGATTTTTRPGTTATTTPGGGASASTTTTVPTTTTTEPGTTVAVGRPVTVETTVPTTQQPETPRRPVTPEQLPRTGASANLALAGMAFVATGSGLVIWGARRRTVLTEHPVSTSAETAEPVEEAGSTPSLAVGRTAPVPYRTPTPVGEWWRRDTASWPIRPPVLTRIRGPSRHKAKNVVNADPPMMRNPAGGPSYRGGPPPRPGVGATAAAPGACRVSSRSGAR